MSRRIPGYLVRDYNRAIKRQGDAAERAVGQALEAYFRENPDASVADAREFAIELMRAAGDLYGNACSQAALELQDEIARLYGTKPPDIGGWLYEPDETSIGKTAHYQATKLDNGDREGFVQGVKEAARYYAERGANSTMSQTARKQAKRGKSKGKRKGAETYGVRFARVPMGSTTCDFCLMLASRGFVYLSEESAGEFDRFHPHCDCRIVPSYEGMDLEGYDPDEYYDRWKHPEKYEEDSGAGVFAEPYWKEDGDPRTYAEIRRDTLANLEKIDSDEFAKSMGRLVGEQVERFVDAARKAVKHRSGTLQEDLYAINLDTGDRIAVTDCKLIKKVPPSEKMNEQIQEWKDAGQRFAMLHNHPENLVPSPEDIYALRERGAEFGIIVCHDGSLFKYTIVGDPIAGCELEDISTMYYNRMRNHDESDVIETIREQTGILLEHIA